jgi:hypothetical protein
MSYSFSRSAGLALVLAAVVLFPVSHANAAGLPQQAGGVVGGMNNWHALEPGQSVEWVFRYPGGNEPALIAFGADPANSISVNVYDDGQWRALGAGEWPVEPVGRGTSGTLGKWSDNQDLIDNGNLFWEAAARPAVLFHIQVTNSAQVPSRYWIAQAGSGAGELTPYSPPVSAAGPGSQPTADASTPATQTQPRQPATAEQTLPGGAGAQGSQPPQTLPITGSASLILLLGAGLVLVAAGRRVHRRSL